MRMRRREEEDEGRFNSSVLSRPVTRDRKVLEKTNQIHGFPVAVHLTLLRLLFGTKKVKVHCHEASTSLFVPSLATFYLGLSATRNQTVKLLRT